MEIYVLRNGEEKQQRFFLFEDANCLGMIELFRNDEKLKKNDSELLFKYYQKKK